MANPFHGPITQWLYGLRSGDEHASTELLNECQRVLLPFVRRSLRESRFYTEAEDVLQSCLGRFGARARVGKFPGLVDRESLWAYLRKATANKLVEHRRRALRLRRGGGGWSRSAVDCDEIEAVTDAPDDRLDFEELVADALGMLPSESHRRVAELDLVKHLSAEEIARELGCGVSTVYRKLHLVKEQWTANLIRPTPMDGREPPS